MPAVSVVMVFHQDTPYFRPAIASVLSQSWKDLELVLVDNGTGLTADQLGGPGLDPRIKWVRLPTNVGIPGGHNAGILAAQGEFIALQDYDDIAVPHRIEAQVAALRKDPALGVVSGRAERIDEKGRALGQVFCLPNPADHVAYAPYGTPVITPVSMSRAEVLRGYPYRPEFPYAADLDFQARVADRWPMAMLPDVLLRYRWYATQTTQRKIISIEQSRCVIQITTARRRVGRPENLRGALQATSAATAAESWRRGARVCLDDSFPVFAAFQARRSFALDRSITSAWHAVRLAWEAGLKVNGAERWLVLKMFLTGPVRTLRLHPV
jgi:glycosyltransferase involved in cell wall biosynthesis